MKTKLSLTAAALMIGVAIFAITNSSQTNDQSKGGEKVDSIYGFNLNDIEGKSVSLEQYRGKVLMLVNVASKCGLTPQYEGLEKLYRTYKDRGLVILGFPANNFAGQEPGTNEEIKSFCSLNYNVTFPLFSKISVKGADIHPLFKFLTDQETNPRFGGEIKWNFNKFLVDKNGQIIARFEPQVKPESEQVAQSVENALSQ
jgi:glutathione peroxidase